MVARSSDGVMTFNITVDIAAPVEEVWAVMTEHRALAGVEAVRDGYPAVG